MSNNTPAISIVMAVYNAEKYLRETLDSVLNQTFYDFELICVDDGSTDDSICILQEYRQRDERITVLRNEVKSQGAAMARNIGINLGD